MSRIQREQCAAATEAAAAEREARAAAEAEQQAEIHARATALLDAVKARIASKTAPLALSSAQTIRRYPDGTIQAVAINTEHEDA